MSYHDEAVKSALAKWREDLGQAYKDYSRVIANLAGLEDTETSRRNTYLLELRRIRRYITKIQWILDDPSYVFDKLKKHPNDVENKFIPLIIGEIDNTLKKEN